MTTAIITKYVGPTNIKPGRIIAATMSDRPVRLIVEYSYETSTRGNHINAAKALATKLDWRGCWVVGDTHSGVVCVNTGSGHEFDFQIGVEG
jgi:hypothetical protein